METKKGNYCQIDKAVYISFQGKNTFIYIPITAFPVGDKRNWNTKSKLCSVSFSTQQGNFQRKHASQVPGGFHTEYSHIKRRAAHLSSEHCLTSATWKNTVPNFSCSSVSELDNSDQLFRTSVVHFSISKEVQSKLPASVAEVSEAASAPASLSVEWLSRPSAPLPPRHTGHLQYLQWFCRFFQR